MLPTIAEFPLSGSFAWTRPTCPVPGDPGDPESHKVRILQADTGNGALVVYVGIPPRDPALRKLGAFAMPASGNTRLPLARLAPSRDEALAIPKTSPARGVGPSKGPAPAKAGVEGSKPRSPRQSRRSAR